MSRMKTCLLACVLACASTHAYAGPLAVDPSAMPGWTGTVGFANLDGLSGTIDFAVWAPNTFPVGNFLGYVPTGPNYYVYTYQAFVTGPAKLSEVGVKLTGPVDNLNIGDFTGNNGPGPVVGDSSIPFPYIVPLNSATWLFDGVPMGGSTDGLAFNSVNGPVWTRTRLVDDGTIAFAIPVPSPSPDNVPEPGTLVLASCGLGVICLRWLRRRGKLMKA